MGKADILDTENCLLMVDVFTSGVGNASRRLDLREATRAARTREGMAGERASMIAYFHVMKC